MVMVGHKSALAKGEQTILLLAPLVLLLCVVSCVDDGLFMLLMVVIPQLWSCSPLLISCVQGAIIKIQG
jgi:hypothetical protein